MVTTSQREKVGARKHDSKKRKTAPKAEKRSPLYVDRNSLKNLGPVAVAYSHVEREWFDTEESYLAEVEVEGRAEQVIEALKELGIDAKGYPGDQYFFTNLIVDDPVLVVNLVDTLKGRDILQTSIPAALELANIPYTGAGMQGLVIGNNRDLIKQLLIASDIPTPEFQVIRRAGTKIDRDLHLPLIVKLNESGGSVGIDNKAVKETYEEAEEQVNELIKTYHLQVVVERFIDGPEVTAVVYDDGKRKHTFLGEKVFKFKPDGKHAFTSLESYEDIDAYTYKLVDEPLASKITKLVEKAFTILRYKDYAKFDIRVDEETNTPYFTDANPNTAFGPDPGLPMTEVLALNGIDFKSLLASLISKHAKKIKKGA